MLKNFISQKRNTVGMQHKFFISFLTYYPTLLQSTMSHAFLDFKLSNFIRLQCCVHHLCANETQPILVHFFDRKK